MPSDAGEKITLGITILLSCSVFQLVIAESTPKTSDYFPVIMIYVAFIMSIAVISTGNAIIILYLNFHPLLHRPPRSVRVFLFEYVAKVLCMYPSVPHDDENINDEELPPGITKVVPISHAISARPSVISNDVAFEVKKLQPGYYPESESMRKIADDVNEICESVRNKTKTEQFMEEWKGVARVVDRLFFWTCLVIVLIACAALFSNKDNSHPQQQW